MFQTHIGRRKCAVALVSFAKGNGDFVINGKTGFSYLQQDPFAIQTVVLPLKLINLEKKYNIICSVRGGGICAQAEAIRLGVARALCSLKSSNLQKITNNQDDSAFSFGSSTTENDSQTQQSCVPSDVRSLLKEQGFLRRDSRIKERRKYGLKKARKAEQYSKR